MVLYFPFGPCTSLSLIPVQSEYTISGVDKLNVLYSQSHLCRTHGVRVKLTFVRNLKGLCNLQFLIGVVWFKPFFIDLSQKNFPLCIRNHVILTNWIRLLPLSSTLWSWVPSTTLAVLPEVDNSCSSHNVRQINVKRLKYPSLPLVYLNTFF